MWTKFLGITNVDFSNRSTIDQILCQVLKKKWEYNGTLHQLFIDYKKAYY